MMTRTTLRAETPAPGFGESPADVHELHPFNPYRAAKDNEVGDYYYKRKNYKAALARYQDALTFKENDALANFHMAQCYEKLDQPEEAITHFKEYLQDSASRATVEGRKEGSGEAGSRGEANLGEDCSKITSAESYFSTRMKSPLVALTATRNLASSRLVP